MINKIINGDCLEVMEKIPDKSIDMILCDLPYGTTACKWDTVIPFEPLWEQYERVIKDNGAIVLTASQPFTTALISSNMKLFKYALVWDKTKSGNFLTAKLKPMISHEDICIFSKGATANGSTRNMLYNPQMEKREKPRSYKMYKQSELYSREKMSTEKEFVSEYRYPKSILTFSNAIQKGKVHPTQKPVSLFEYLIKTYTNEGDTVLDNCMGSFTTAVACDNSGRKWIGIEKEMKYCEIGLKRVNDNRERLGMEEVELIDRTLELKGC